MNKWKIFAIIFTIFSIGAVQEMFRIFTSADADVAHNRASLIPVSIILTGVFIFLSVWFWRKSAEKKMF